MGWGGLLGAERLGSKSLGVSICLSISGALTGQESYVFTLPPFNSLFAGGVGSANHGLSADRGGADIWKWAMRGCEAKTVLSIYVCFVTWQAVMF